MNIYIGNLPRETNEGDVKSLFEPFGEVTSIKLIKDRDTDQFKGFGFLEMSQSSGLKAIKDLNDSEVNGRKIVVNEARPKNDNDRNYNRR